jgi:tRNA-specific 2-thiouridylase
MRTKPSVLVAMSGGVDSSVAACLLHEQGYRVLGSHLKLVAHGGVEHGCCGPQAEADARAVAEIAGFDFEVVNMTDHFERTVLADFFAEHRAGRTPNPCVRCNEHIKFRAFLDRADALGFDHVATGHYARTWRDRDGRWHLAMGADPSKDQSYVLHTLGQRQLARTLFPVGGQPKAETRAHAVRFGLPVASKADSMEVCFVPGTDHASYLASNAPELVRAGEVVSATTGAVMGTHEGSFRYTIGQRRGLGVSTGERSYVVDVDPVANQVMVGPGELLARRGLRAERMQWVVGHAPAARVEGSVRVRYRGPDAPAVVHATPDDGAIVEFRIPERAIAPGQSVVVYQGEEVLGGGIIAEAWR